jgi:hypothetical protein
MDIKLERYVKIHELNKSEERLEFERTHTLYMGIVDDEGVEGIVKIDKNDPDQMGRRYKSMELRCRMNGQRNGVVCGFWVDNIMLPHIKDKLKSRIFQNYLKEIAYKV